MADTIKIGNLEIDNLKVGTLSVDALYIGDVKIYPPTPPTPKYVLTLSDSSTISARCDGTSAVTSGEVSSQYSGSVVSAEIGDCVTSIGDYAFINCRSLTSCTIGSGVTTISYGAFQNAGLVSLHIPSGVTSISANAFSNCASLTSITVDSNNSAYDSRNNCNALIKTSTNELILGCGNTIIPNGVTTIGNGAFINCSGLTGNFDIPNSVRTIGSNAFRPCSGLTSITIGTGITFINMYAFYGCSSLTSITINATTPPRLSDANAFENTNNCPIYVPCDSVDAYKAASGWSSLASRITCVQPKTLQWVTFNNGDAIPSEDVYKTYGFRIPTQVVYDLFGNGKEVSMAFYSEEVDHEQHSVSVIEFAFPYEGGVFFTINGQSQTVSYDPKSDEYLEIIFSDYGVNYNYNITSFNYGEQGDTEIVYEFPFDMDLYEEDTPTPPTPTLKWVEFTAGDTIPSTLDIYGIKFSDAEMAMNTFSDSSQPFYIEPYRRVFDIYIGGKYYDQISTSFEVVFSEISSTYTGDYLNFNNDIVVNQSSGTIQLYIYA